MLFFTFLLFTLPLSAQTKVYVYAHAEQGFVDSPRLTDSVKDLNDVISKRKGLMLVTSKDAADLLIEVVSSGNVATAPKETTATRRGIFGGTARIAPMGNTSAG